MAMCSICGGKFVMEGISVEDGPTRLALGVSGLVVEVVKDPALDQPERDEKAWEAASVSLARQLRDHHHRGDVAVRGYLASVLKQQAETGERWAVLTIITDHPKGEAATMCPLTEEGLKIGSRAVVNLGLEIASGEV